MMSSTNSSDDEQQTSVKKHQKKLNSSKKISKKKRKYSSSSTSSSESSSTSGSESDNRKSKSKKRSKHSKKKSRNKKFEPKPKLRTAVDDSESETERSNMRLKASTSTSKPPESPKTNDNLPGSSVIENPPKADESLKKSTPEGQLSRIEPTNIDIINDFKKLVYMLAKSTLFDQFLQPYKFLMICKNKECHFAILHDCVHSSSDIISNAHRARDQLGNIYDTLEVGKKKRCKYCSFVVIHKSCQNQPNHGGVGMYTSVSTHTRVCSDCNWQVVHTFRSGQKGRRCHWVTNKNSNECTCGCIEIRHVCGLPFKKM